MKECNRHVCVYHCIRKRIPQPTLLACSRFCYINNRAFRVLVRHHIAFSEPFSNNIVSSTPATFELSISFSLSLSTSRTWKSWEGEPVSGRRSGSKKLYHDAIDMTLAHSNSEQRVQQHTIISTHALAITFWSLHRLSMICGLFSNIPHYHRNDKRLLSYYFVLFTS